MTTSDIEHNTFTTMTGGDGRRRRRGARRVRAVIASMLVVLGMSLLVAGTTYAQNPPDSHRPATWNMQGGRDRWIGVYNISQFHSVVALQEVPSRPPAGAVPTGRRIGRVVEYTWQRSRRGPLRYLYILPQGSRNLGMVTSFRATRAFELTNVYRSLLAVYDGNTNMMFASAHASANGGGDAASLVRRGQNVANANGWNWAVLGDFNRDPMTLARPSGTFLYNTGQATQQSAGELDYMVSNIETDNWQATVGVNQGSDHWPVYFASLRAAAAGVTIHSVSNGGNLDVLGGGNADGTRVGVYHANNAPNQLWSVSPTTSSVLYRIVSHTPGGVLKCLDVNNGQRSRLGDYLNIWTCHAPNGYPDPGGIVADTQNFALEGADRYQPNLTMLHDIGSNGYANVLGNAQGDGVTVGQWFLQVGAPNEEFYFHPQESINLSPQ